MSFRNRMQMIKNSTKVPKDKDSFTHSRTERRLLERKPQIQKWDFFQLFKTLQKSLVRWSNPRVAGSGVYFDQEHFKALAYRLPIALILGFMLTNEDISPYVIQGSIGPSMLPTIQFFGDLWLVETGAWSRLLGLYRKYEVGDIILWKDPATGRVSCKRVVGIGGDRVLRYGKYAALYQHRDDWAIIWPKDGEAPGLDQECQWDQDPSKPIAKTIELSHDHVLVEGDCPPFSLVSQHYGPIPVSWTHGSLVLLVRPLYREDKNGSKISAWVSRNRPVPFPSVDDYLGKRFNFYLVPKVDV